MKIRKKDCMNHSLRGITLGQKGNFCGNTDVEVVAIDYGSESVLLSGFNKAGITIKELSKKELKKVYYIKKAKENDYNMWVSIDAIEKYNTKEEEECDEYEAKFNDFIKRITEGNFSDGDEFCDIRLERSSSTIEDSYHPYATPENIKVFTIEYDFNNAYKILSERCDMNDARELSKILNSTTNYIYWRETVTEEIIHDLYLDNKIYSYQKMKDGRIIIVILN